MNHPTHSRAAWLGACALAVLTHCGGAQQPATTTTVAASTAATPPARAAEPAPDLSEAPAPADLVAVLRASSLVALADRAGQLTGLGAVLRAQVDQVYASFGRALSDVIDRNAPVDVLVVAPGPGEPQVVLSFGTTGSVADLERSLGQGHRFAPMTNGARRIEPLGGGDQAGAASEHGADDEAQLRRSVCVVAPTPRAGTARLLCAQHAAELEAVLAYDTRTLSRRDVPADAATLDLPMEAVRTHYLQSAVDQIHHARDEADAQIAHSLPPGTEPALRDAVSRLVHEIVDAIGGLLTDPMHAEAALSLRADRASLHIGIDLTNPSSSLLRGVLEGVRGQPAVPADLVAHLLPDGWLYQSGAIDLRTLRATAGEITEIGTSLSQHAPGLAAADRTAMQQALQLFSLLDQAQFAAVVGNDAQGVLWSAGTARFAATQGTQVVTAAHNAVLALRRPAVRRLLAGLLNSANASIDQLGDLRDVPTRGLPAGSFAFRVPDPYAMHAPTPTAPATPGHHGPARGATAHAPPAGGTPYELLVVPDGQNVTVVLARDARAVFTRYQANTTAGVDPALLTSAGTAASAAIVPAGLPNLIRANNATQGQQVAALVSAMSDHGRTPITVHATSTESAGTAHLVLETDVPATVLQGIVGSFAPGAGPPPSAAGGNPCGGP